VKLPEKVLKSVLEPSVCTKLIYIVLQVKDELDEDETYNALYVIGRVYQVPHIELSLETNQFVCSYTQKMLYVEGVGEQAAKVVAILTHSSISSCKHIETSNTLLKGLLPHIEEYVKRTKDRNSYNAIIEGLKERSNFNITVL